MIVYIKDAPDRIVCEIRIVLPLGSCFRLLLLLFRDSYKSRWHTVLVRDFDRNPSVTAGPLQAV